MADRVRTVIQRAKDGLPGDRLDRIEAATRKISDLKERGLLKKQEYQAATGAELERRYSASMS